LAVSDARFIGPINLVTSSVRNAELAHALGKALGRPSFVPTPGCAVRVAVGELADYLLAGRRIVPARLRSLGFTWTKPTLESALAAEVAR
jgi:NAD dependent epimerase/dehydratase family enzyme